MLAAEERCGLERQIMWSDIEGPERREGRGKIGDVELEDMLGADQVLEAVLSAIDERRSSGQGIPDKLRGRLRQQYLSAVTGAQQPRHPVERRPEVVAVALLGRAGVQG